MLKPSFAVTFSLVWGLCSGHAAGQDAAPKETGLTIKTTSQEVVLDLVVRDSHGKQVKNLQAGDITILEDGAPQTIRSFRLISGKETLQQQIASAKVAKQPQSNPLRAVNLVCLVFHNLEPFTKKYAVDAVQEFLKSQLSPDTWIAVFTLDSKLRVLQPFTTNKNEVMQAATRTYTGQTVDFAQVATAVLTASPNVATIQVAMSGNPAKGGTVTATQSLTGGELNSRAITGADVGTDAASNAQRGDLVGQRRQFGEIDAMRETDQMLEMIKQLGTLPGRKSILLFTPGLSTTGDADLFKAMVDKANKADVTIYGIDVNGLSENSTGLASGAALGHAASLSASQAQKASTAEGAAGSGGVNMEKMRQSDYIGDAVRTSDTQASLRAFAEGTGGFLIGSTNDFRKPFQHILEDLDTHYEVIYHPSSGKFDGRLRNIEVKTGRKEVTVQSRTGYYALPVLGSSPDLAPYEMTALAALNIHNPPHAFDFHAAGVPFRPAASASKSTLAFELPAASLSATPEPNVKRHRVDVGVFALVKDSSGQVVDKFNQQTPYEIPDQNLDAMRKSMVTFTHALTLPPGHYTVEAAALDLEAGRASTSKAEFDSPEQKGVGLSGVLLVQRLEPVTGQADANDPLQFQASPTQAQKVVPELNTNLSADAHPYVYFVVYQDKSIAEKPKIQVEFLVGGKLLAKQTADLPPADATGAIPMVIGAAAKPGDCELRITAMQGGSSMQRSAVYHIAAK